MISGKSPERIKRFRIGFYSLSIIYFLYFIHDLSFEDSDQPGRYLWTIFAIFLVMLPFAFEKLMGFYIPWKIKIIVILSLLLHTMGEFHRWYYTLAHYDKITHIVSAMGIAYLVFIFLILIELYYGLCWKRSSIIFFIIIITMAFSFFWEWWEIFSDSYFGSKFFWNLQDGMGDTISNAIGAAIVSWDANKYLKKRSYDEIASDFILQDEDGYCKIRWEVLPGIREQDASQDKRVDDHHIIGSDSG